MVVIIFKIYEKSKIRGLQKYLKTEN